MRQAPPPIPAFPGRMPRSYSIPLAACLEEDRPRLGEGVPMPQPTDLDRRHVCRSIRLLTAELFLLAGDRVQARRDRRRAACHVRQISMYVCHVALRLSLTDIGIAFGRDRTTVGHACNVVEDRRDNQVYDAFVSSVERIAAAVYGVEDDHG
ncbi:helix-turn-helix domain-containing protein [Ensifer soli]|uniref:helix-turn-helix domain-containing protein n=1 Tax=Ciceribacter sp. sgz301302 TaxID=3342379 RepID=UPI0035B92404